MNRVSDSFPPPPSGGPFPSGRQFIVGHDIKGRWVVCDQIGAVGGIFMSRESALSFAKRESGSHPEAIFCAPDHLIMDFFSIIAHPGGTQPEQ